MEDHKAVVVFIVFLDKNKKAKKWQHTYNYNFSVIVYAVFQYQYEYSELIYAEYLKNTSYEVFFFYF